MSDPRTRHVALCGLWYTCDICGEKLEFEDAIVALAGNASSTSFKTGFISPFRTEIAIHERWEKDVVRGSGSGRWCLCRQPERLCNEYHGPSRPGCAVHRECLQVFMRHYTAEDDALDRLWQACAWRRVPWVGGARVPELRLRPQSVWNFVDAFIVCAERCGLRGVDGLPQVVLGAILEALPRSGSFWRCVAALDLARRLSVAPLQPLRIVQLGRVVAWERGTVPQLAADDSVEPLPPFFRLTIDADGLQRVKRLAERPRFSRERFDDRAFVVEREDWFGVTLAQFKNGLLQLSVLEDPQDPGFAVWDTPTPPDLAQCPVPLERLDSGQRFHTIDLASVTGVTFFFFHNRIVAIHAHSPSHPCAMFTYKGIQDIRDLNKYCTWVYMPLPRGDTVLSCGPFVHRDRFTGALVAPRLSSFLIRTRLSGETVVGRYRLVSDADVNDPSNGNAYFLTHPDQSPPTTLVYCIGPGRHILGASIIVPLDEHGTQSGTVEDPPSYPPPDTPHPYADYSYAPLENVRQVRVFYEQDGVGCMGMLFEYDNGGQRALGQCRLHVAEERTYMRPRSVAFAKLAVEEGDIRGVKVCFGGPSSCSPDGEKWEHYAMVGTLEFWFTGFSADISVRGGTLMPDGEDGEGLLKQLADSV